MIWYSYLTFFLTFFVTLSASLWYLFVPISRAFTNPDKFINASSLELFSHPAFWSCVLLIPVLVLCRDFLWKFYLRQFSPHPYHIVQELKLIGKPKDINRKDENEVNLFFEGANPKPRRSRGFSFSQTYGQTRVLQAYGQSPKLTSKLQHLIQNKDGI